MSAGKPTGQQAAGADHQQDLQRQIAQTRQQLGQTVAALEHKLDVRARARDTAADLRAQVQDKAAGVKERAWETAGGLSSRVRERGPQVAGVLSRQRIPLAVAVGVVVLIASAVQWWRSRRA